MGTTFGDGGIFENLNAIFLSSAELDAVKEFGEDLKVLFGNSISNNSRVIDGGEYGHSWCYQNTNRNIIRFFHALDAPKGRKSQQPLRIPEWIFFQEAVADEFFGSLFGGELGTPSIHKLKNQLTSIDLGMVTMTDLKEQAIKYLEQVRKYLTTKALRTGSISISKSEAKLMLRLQISKDLENYSNFVKRIKLRYCHYKQDRLKDALEKFIKIKSAKYKHLIIMGYSEDEVVRLLQLTKESLKLLR